MVNDNKSTYTSHKPLIHLRIQDSLPSSDIIRKTSRVQVAYCTNGISEPKETGKLHSKKYTHAFTGFTAFAWCRLTCRDE